MTVEIYRDTFGVITYDDVKGILELQWLEGTASMSDDDFMRWLELFAGFGEQYRCPFMIIDVKQFRHRPGAHIGPWRDEHIIPRYNKAGVKKFAFLVPSGVAPGTDPAPEGPAVFPTGYFDSRARIEEWFSS